MKLSPTDYPADTVRLLACCGLVLVAGVLCITGAMLVTSLPPVYRIDQLTVLHCLGAGAMFTGAGSLLGVTIAIR